tara:strand:- start:151 stop:627 length:477 start_codon:yes stop_codon:yes gene_type:complete
MNLVEFGKICGILFFVVMCWYFIFVVFKTNKDYLRSLAGMDNVVEGFSDDQNTRLENSINQMDGAIKFIREQLGVGEGGKEEQRKLITDYLEKGLRMMKLSLIQVTAQVGTLSPKDGPKMFEALDKNRETYVKNIKEYEDALTYFTEEQTISENEGLI